LFEAEFPRGEFQPEKIDDALAYLFKVDPADSAAPPPGFGGFRVFLPPGNAPHCGLLRLSDTNMVYLHLEGMDSGRVCNAPGLSTAPHAGWGSPGGETARRRFLAALMNTVGMAALEDSSYKEAKRRFQQAAALDSLAPEYVANQAALHALRRDPAGGVALLLRHPALLDSSGQLCGILGAFYEELNRYSEARDWALKAVAKDADNIEWLINLSDALWGLGERVQSKNVLLRPYSQKPGFRLAIYLAATHLGLEEYENALAVLERAHADSAPTAKSSAYILRAYLGLKRFEDGLDFIRERGDLFAATSENLFLKAACEFNLRLYRQAQESVRQSLRLNASDREAQELQNRLAALLGDKSNRFLRARIAPLRTGLSAAQVRKRIEDSTWEAGVAAPIILVTQQVVHQWTPKGRWKQTRHLFFLVPDGRKLIRHSELTFDLNPSFERFHVNRLQVYDSAWKPVYTGKLEDTYVTKNHNTTLHPENLLVHVALKRRPGKMYVEALVTREAQVLSPEYPYVRFEHHGGYPVLHSRFDLLHPPKNLLISPFGQVAMDTLPDRIVLTMETPAYPSEGRFAPDPEEFGSGFSASPFTTWRDVGSRYLGQLRKAGVDPEKPPLAVRERSNEIAGGLRENPVRDLFRYVRDSIRYDNFAFSLHASIPDSAPVVLSKSYSDCKGHALLLAQLLRARGIEAHLSLVNLYRLGDVGQPHLNQFNHMIVHVPRQKGAGPYFLDATEKFAAFRRYPLHLEGRNTLVLDPGNPRLYTIPQIDSAGEHSVQVFHELEVSRAQIAAGRDSLILRGKAASEFREHLAAWNPGTKHQNLLAWLSSGYTAFNEDSFHIQGEDDPDRPLIFVLHYHSRFPYLKAAQAFDYFPKLELSFLRFPAEESRNAPVYFPHEITIESNWTYKLPTGFAWKSLSLARELEEEHLLWKFSILQSTPETIQLRQQWRIDPFLVEPGEYRRLRGQWEPVLRRCGLRLAISKL
jgi:tetratricopeptide (TPR) repeat protein